MPLWAQDAVNVAFTDWGSAVRWSEGTLLASAATKAPLTHPPGLPYPSKRTGRTTHESVVVVVIPVYRVAVAVVQVVDVVAVRHGHVPAAFPVRMGVPAVLRVAVRLALVEVAVVRAVQVTVVDVVDVVPVRNRDVPATVAVGVVFVTGVCDVHKAILRVMPSGAYVHFGR